jgi:hypothetical protein
VPFRQLERGNQIMRRLQQSRDLGPSGTGDFARHILARLEGIFKIDAVRAAQLGIVPVEAAAMQLLLR